MKELKTIHYENEKIDASPVKSFFVTMLTRDIRLDDAILDLLDNCVDGILRSSKGTGDKPYRGYKAEIEFNKSFFSISDNCGGIPWDLHDYAFRMGRAPTRPDDTPRTLGVYGIGMKRAIFKIGKDCRIITRCNDIQYEVEISHEWMADESDWELPVKDAEGSMDTNGTQIVIENLNPGIAEQFDENSIIFKTELERLVATHYAYIIEKGFEVKINGNPVKPRTIGIVFDEGDSTPGIRPYIFQTKTPDGVEVFLTVGFTRPIPSQSEMEDEKENARYSSIDAGWTILCNDRVVVYCDRTELTGWGEANVPRYHNQFIAISGLVEFKSDDPSKLPTITTKRGIDASSTIYLQVKNKMREGMKIFTEYTNKWKAREDETKKQISSASRLSLYETKKRSESLPFNKISKSYPQGQQYMPKLPEPEKPEKTTRRISFSKEIKKIRVVTEYFGNPEMEPSEVGEKCFDVIYKEARK